MNSNSPTNKTVLVISHCPEQFELAASMLEAEGCSVLFERDLYRAIDMVRAAPPELIVSELAAPDIDGLELCSILRKEPFFLGPKVLLVGDLSRRSTIVAEAIECGANDYLQKPMDHFELYERCSGLLAIDAEIPQELLGQDESFYLSLVDDISENGSIIDANGIVLSESPYIERVFGYHQGELEGKRMADLIHPLDIGAFNEFLDSVYWIGGASESIVYRFLQKDGSWRMVESNARPVKDPQFGSSILLISKAPHFDKFPVNNALENGVLRRAMFENASIGMAVLSPSGHVIGTNKALLEMLDHTVEELHGMALSEIIIPRDPHADRRALAEVLSGRRDYYEFRNGYHLPNGDRLWGKLTLTSIPADGENERCLMVIFEDPFSDGLYLESAAPEMSVPAYAGASNVLDIASWKIDRALVSAN